VTIQGTDHQPPPAPEVPSLVEEMCDYVNDSWMTSSPIHLASYLMWRINWIHPFSGGNGRTSRAVSYLVMCARLGYRLPGALTIPDQIVEHRDPYYAALDAADLAWTQGSLDVSVMEGLLSTLLARQLIGVHAAAGGQASSAKTT
jgi:Fic family protein